MNTRIPCSESNTTVYSFPKKYHALTDQQLENSQFGGLSGRSCNYICDTTNTFTCY